jgi:hypothetical protein
MHDRRPFVVTGLRLAGLLAVSLPLSLALSGPTFAFTNTLVNDPTTDVTARDTQSSTSTIVFGSTVLTAFNDTGSSAGGAIRFTGWSRSTDGGVTFTDLGALTSSLSDVGFPFLARNAVTGTVYLSTLTQAATIQVFRSFNGGLSFFPPVLATPGVAFPVFDREVLAVDNLAGGGNVYLLGTDFGGTGAERFFRSTDDGMTWGPSGGLAVVSGTTANGPFLVVAPDHSIYAFWYEDSGVQRLMVRRSTTLGLTFGAAVPVATLSTTGPDGDMGLGGFHTNAFPQAVVNPVNGNVYIVYPDNPVGTDRADIFFRQSTDSGVSWSAAVRVNDDATTRDQWQPSLAVTPDGSRVFVGWYDRRLDAANTMIDNYGRIATVSGATVTFGADFRITDQSYPPVFGVDPALNVTYMGDWDECAADNSFFYYSWGDNRDPSLGHAGNQANVRLAKIPVAGTTGVAAAGVAGGGRMALSPKANPFSGVLDLALDLETASTASRVELAIYDVGGRRIAGTNFGAMGGGTHELAWDGRDSIGRDAGAGTFLAVVRVDGRSVASKVVRLR